MNDNFFQEDVRDCIEAECQDICRRLREENYHIETREHPRSQPDGQRGRATITVEDTVVGEAKFDIIVRFTQTGLNPIEPRRIENLSVLWHDRRLRDLGITPL